MLENLDLLQALITLGSIAGGIFGILGKKKYQRITEVVITAIESGGHKQTKANVSAWADQFGVTEPLNHEIKRVTGRAVKRERK